MNKPRCCGRNAPLHVKRIPDKHPHSWVSYWKCAICGRVGNPFSALCNDSYMDSLDAVREGGLAFDATLK